MLRSLFFSLFALAISSQSHAQVSLNTVLEKIPGGTYGGGKYRIVKTANSVVLNDLENKIVYSHNLNDGSWQYLPADFIRSLRNRGATAGASSMVKGIALRNPRAESPNMLKVDVRIDIEYSSSFGSFSSTIELETNLNVQKYSKWVKRGDQYEMVEGAALAIHSGDFMKLTSIKTTMPGALNGFLAVLADVGIRLGSLSLRVSDYITQDIN